MVTLAHLFGTIILVLPKTGKTTEDFWDLVSLENHSGRALWASTILRASNQNVAVPSLSTWASMQLLEILDDIHHGNYKARNMASNSKSKVYLALLSELTGFILSGKLQPQISWLTDFIFMGGGGVTLPYPLGYQATSSWGSSNIPR